MAAEPLIELQDIAFAYPTRPALFESLSITFSPGDRVGLVGANGSGKTTLLHLVVGLLRPAAGGVIVCGAEAKSEADFQQVRRRVGLLFQDSDDQLFCPTVAEDVAFGPLNLGAAPEEAERRAMAALEQLGIAHTADRPVYDLSGGEKRLVALAGVLVMDPAALLLDEPAAGLDPAARNTLEAVLAEVGAGQIITSHDMEFVRSTCRRVVLLREGEIIADGPTDDILGDAERMLASGLEVPFSIEAESGAVADHTHGAGPGHGHGHRRRHPNRQPRQSK